eukprot:2823063-Prymnesium_polylepis.1
MAAAVVKFRASGGQAPPADTPLSVLQVVNCISTELHISGFFPRTTCSIQADMSLCALRWTHRHFISLHTVQDAQLVSNDLRPSATGHARGSVRCSTASPARGSVRGSTVGPAVRVSKAFMKRSSSAAATLVHITYNGSGGISKVIELRMPAIKASAWVDGLQLLLEMLPRLASPAHHRWAISCVVATGTGSPIGSLPSTRLRILLKMANASARLSTNAIQDAVRSADERIDRQNLPTWLRAAGHQDDGRRTMLGGWPTTSK